MAERLGLCFVRLTRRRFFTMSDTYRPHRSVHFDLADLRLFVCIAEAQNLTRGAKRAFLSPAAASARLKALEEQLGSRLFYRSRRGVSLAPAGHTLLRHAHLVLRQVQNLKSEFSEYSADTVGHIRIFANTTAVTEFLPEVLAGFLAERPRVSVDLQERLTRAIVRGVREEAADLGIVAGPVPTSGLQALHFSTDRLVVVTPKAHALAHRRRLAFIDTVPFEHIGLHEGSTLQTFVRDQAERHGTALSLRIQVRSFEAMCRMIEAGVGIGVLPESAAHRHRRTMRLSTVQLSDPWAVRERRILVRDLQALPGCARALIHTLMAAHESEASR